MLKSSIQYKLSWLHPYVLNIHPGKTRYITCRVQYKMKMWNSLFKKQEKYVIKGTKI